MQALLVTLVADRRWEAVARGQNVHGPTRMAAGCTRNTSQTSGEAVHQPKVGAGSPLGRGLPVTSWSGWGCPWCESSSGETAVLHACWV